MMAIAGTSKVNWSQRCRRRTAEGELLDTEDLGAPEVVVGKDQNLVGGAVIASDEFILRRLIQPVDECVVAIPTTEAVGAAAALNDVISGVGAD